MNPKNIITAALLFFVAVSVAYLVVKESCRGPAGQEKASLPAQPDTASSRDNGAPDAKTSGIRVVAYYFHGSVRCATCRSIEAFAKEAVETAFAAELKDGRLEWRVVNIEEPEGEHFVQDFQLATRSVVLERISGGKRIEWKNLQLIWELVRRGKEDFMKYIQDETRGYLEAAAK